MTRWAARSDRNQDQIVRALRAAGCDVYSLHRCGMGVPDLLVGIRGATFLLEVKLPGETLNAMQRGWHQRWKGHAAVVHTADEALRVCGLLR